MKLKLQYFYHLMQSTDLLEKTQMLRKIEGGRRRYDRGWGGWMASPMRWTWAWVSSRIWWRSLACCSPWGCKELDTTEGLNWAEELSTFLDLMSCGLRLLGCTNQVFKILSDGSCSIHLLSSPLKEALTIMSVCVCACVCVRVCVCVCGDECTFVYVLSAQLPLFS